MSLAIIGLSFLGTSLGLALKAAIPQLVITGHDPSPEVTALAKKRGAIDKSHWNISAACEGADMVLLDLPFDQLEATLQVLAETLNDDTLILDLTPSVRAAQSLAAGILPPTLRYLGVYIVPDAAVDTVEPSAAAMRGAMFYLAAAQATNESALNTAARLAEAVGAKPYFTAYDELDSLIAAGSQAPYIAAMALMSAWQQTEGWQDRQHALAASSRWAAHLARNLPDAKELALWQNRDMLLDWLNRVIDSMREWRDMLTEEDSIHLNAAITLVRKAAHAAKQEQESATEETRSLGVGQLFLGSIGRRLQGKR